MFVVIIQSHQLVEVKVIETAVRDDPPSHPLNTKDDGWSW